VSIPSDCPSEPLTVEFYRNGVWVRVSAESGVSLSCEEGVDEVSTTFPENLTLPAQGSYQLDYSPWKDQLFSELGKYRITLPVTVEGVLKSFLVEFQVTERGFFSSVAFRLFFQPIYNVLLFLASVVPGHNLGLAVVLLTLIIRLILLVPNQKALKSQRAMMKIQPEIEAVKRKYKGDQQRISQETMALWKRHKVNPVGGCLPLLIQLPILVALFYVIKHGFNPYQTHFAYSFLSSVNLSAIDPNFYGILQLGQVNMTWLPLLVGLLQFAQMKLAFSKHKLRGDAQKEQVVDVSPDGKVKSVQDKHEPNMQDSLQMMNKTMIYVMPFMMALMVATFPSAVGLYLAVSTLFAIGQQVVVNKSVQ
ncbi:MAG: YidC/Oxa1 family membrane protein insertase, partial [bacterium]|nr:YidC/Oxa1 family membrane protein insertase [bacterium]